MFAVYHNAFGDVMKKVAIVVTDTLEGAYRDTNSIDQPWTGNKNVYPIAGVKQARSTSVGDILMDMNSEKWFTVSHVGFEEIQMDTMISFETYSDDGMDRFSHKATLSALLLIANAG